MDDLLAKALNRYSDGAFLKVLSERDRTVMSELVEEFFRSGIAEEKQGKWLLK